MARMVVVASSMHSVKRWRKHVCRGLWASNATLDTGCVR